MQGRKHRIFNEKAQKQSDQEERRKKFVQEGREVMANPPLNQVKPIKRQRVNFFKASRVYQRPNSEDSKNQSPYRYNVNHITVEGRLIPCSLFDCNKADNSQDSKDQVKIMGKNGAKIKDVQLGADTSDRTPQKSMKKQKPPGFEGKQKQYEIKADPPVTEAAPSYHASYIPNTEPAPPRKTTIFLPRACYQKKSATMGFKRRRSLSSSRKYLKRVQELPQMQSIKEESQNSKLNSSNSSVRNSGLKGLNSNLSPKNK